MRRFTIVLLVLVAVGCSDSDKPDISKTETGYWVSNVGNFAIKFPAKPNISKLNNTLGDRSYPTWTFIYSPMIDRKYIVEYIDLDPTFFENQDLESLLKSSRTTSTNQLPNYKFGTESFQNQNPNGPTLDTSGSFGVGGEYGVFYQKLVKAENRLYSVLLIAARNIPSDDEALEFMNSFKVRN